MSLCTVSVHRKHHRFQWQQVRLWWTQFVFMFWFHLYIKNMQHISSEMPSSPLHLPAPLLPPCCGHCYCCCNALWSWCVCICVCVWWLACVWMWILCPELMSATIRMQPNSTSCRMRLQPAKVRIKYVISKNSVHMQTIDQKLMKKMLELFSTGF